MIQVFYGSQTGNARNLAHVLSDALNESGLHSNVHDMVEVDPEILQELKMVLIVTSTYGDGEAPDNAAEWLSFLKFADELDLKHLRFAVLGLGDTYYPHFCQCAKDFDQFLKNRGARQLVERLDCDRYFEDQYGDWLKKLINVLKNELQG